MKRIYYVFLFFLLLVSQDAVRAAEQGASGRTVDLLNDDYTGEEQAPENPVFDPLEPVNRVFFAFNDKLYYWVLKPVRTGYAEVVSEDIRQCIANFLNNLSTPVSLLNNLLQGRVEDAGVVFSRFLINTTLGVYGFGDPAATAFDLKPKPTDFGITLGVYGVGDGMYFCWPVLGPMNTRDTFGYVGDLFTHPTAYMNMDVAERAGYYMGKRINADSLGPDVYDDLKKLSLDPYVAARQAMFEFRRNQIEKQKK